MTGEKIHVMRDALVTSPDSPAINERMLLLVLAAIQFTTVLDFLIILPLGP